MKYELQLQMNFRSAFGELKRQTKDNVSCSVIVRTRDIKPNIIGVTEVTPKNNRYKPACAEYTVKNAFRA